MLLYQSGYQVSVERVVCGSDRGRHGGIEACLVEVRVIHLLLLLLPLLIVSKELSRIGRRILSFFFFFRRLSFFNRVSRRRPRRGYFWFRESIKLWHNDGGNSPFLLFLSRSECPIRSVQKIIVGWCRLQASKGLKSTPFCGPTFAFAFACQWVEIKKEDERGECNYRPKNKSELKEVGKSVGAGAGGSVGREKE